MRAVLAPLLTSLLFAGALGCASAPPPPVRRAPAPPPQPVATALPEWKKQPAPRKVEVHGIEGTLHSFDVKIAMEKKAAEFAACHEPRAKRVPMLAGTLEFGIAVEHSGVVQKVALRNSDVGDRELERCFVDVITAMQFPKPNGGDANVTYTMLLGPAGKAREPEPWTPGRVQHVLDKREPDLIEQCALPAGSDFVVTAYVNARGKVVTAGVTAQSTAEPQHFDCIAQALRRWTMPKPSKKKRFAKVTFPLHARS